MRTRNAVYSSVILTRTIGAGSIEYTDVNVYKSEHSKPRSKHFPDYESAYTWAVKLSKEVIPVTILSYVYLGGAWDLRKAVIPVYRQLQLF